MRAGVRGAATVAFLFLGSSCERLEERAVQRALRDAEAQRSVLCPECSVSCLTTEVSLFGTPCYLMKDQTVVHVLQCRLGGCRRIAPPSLQP